MTPRSVQRFGAFPKPNYTPIGDWFDISRKTGGMNSAETTKNYQADLSKNKDKNEIGIEHSKGGLKYLKGIFEQYNANAQLIEKMIFFEHIGDTLFSFIVFVIFAALSEEVFFRGTIQRFLHQSLKPD